MDRNAGTRSMKQSRFSLSQETITILTVGVALAGIMIVNHGNMRAEARAERHEMRAEARADRARTDAALNAMRAEGRADREAFAKQINRLLEQQGALSGLVDGLEHAIASPGE